MVAKIAGILAAVLWVSGCAHFARGDAKKTQVKIPDVVQSLIKVETKTQRVVSVRIFAPASGCDQCSLIVFSHGANAAPDRYDALLIAWAEAGHVVAAPMHVDSEEYADREKFQPPSYLPLRREDFTRVTAAFLQDEATPNFAFDFNGSYIAAGHSFGALIAQIDGGAMPLTQSRDHFAENQLRPQAILAISPPPSFAPLIGAQGWAAIDVPMLVVTGTNDILPGLAENWEQHLDSYEAGKKELAVAVVFDEMDHYFNGAFGRENPDHPNASPGSVGALNAIALQFIAATKDKDFSADKWSPVSDGSTDGYTILQHQ